jgi:chemotaxis protein CheC
MRGKRGERMASDGSKEVRLDLLREVVNIGVGNAITSLAELTGKPFRMEVPDVAVVPYTEIPNLLSIEEPTVGIYAPTTGELTGHGAFAFPWSSAVRLWDMVLGTHPDDPHALDDMHASTMLEIGNIIISAYLNAISDLGGMTCRPEPPLLAVDMAEALLETMVAAAVLDDACALAVNNHIYGRECSSDGHFIFLPSEGSLVRLFAALGVEEAA